MLIRLTLSLCMLLVSDSTTFGQGPEWHAKLKEIIPGVSSYNEVERSFNRSELTKTFADRGIEARYYATPYGRLSVYIALKNCKIHPDVKEISKGTVIEATLFPVRKVPVAKFGITKSGFRKTQEDDNPTTHLINPEAGLDYAVQAGRVIHVTVFPRHSSAVTLKCL